MQEETVRAARRLLPRWRSLERTPFSELVSTKRDIAPRSSKLMQRYLERWNQEKSLIHAADVIDAAIISGDRVPAVPAALSIVKNEYADASLQRAARQVLGQLPDRPKPLLASVDEWHDTAIRDAIVKLKNRLSLSPRDGLTALEIARLQSQNGQHKSAQRYVQRALACAPNDRYVLRSAARFFEHESVREDAEISLKAIWASDSVRHDPWVQAAELAVAGICEKPPRWAVKGRAALLEGNSRGINFSELAGGLAILELEAGAPKRRVRKLLDLSLGTPTENALAQAVWSSNEGNLHINVSEHLKSIPNAYEARARTAYESGDYRTASKEGWEWLDDQHLSPNAATFGTFVCCVLLSDYKGTLQFAERGLKANPNDYNLINSKIVALALDGKVKEAAAFMPRLDAFDGVSDVKPFVFAARGLIAFRQGNFLAGREMYAQAIESARRSSRPTLSGNAALFWLEQELLAGTISPDDATQFLAKIDEAYATRPYGAGKSVSWIARRKVIVGLLDMMRMRRYILGSYTKLLPNGSSLEQSAPKILIT